MVTGQKVEWQAARYDRLADPHERWAEAILARLGPRRGERILDAGCGSGRITRLLCQRLATAGPGWSVLAVDASRAMVEQARAALTEYGDSLEAQNSDLLELDLSSHAVDAVFSCAVFHWIDDHARLFQRAYGWLLPGGRLVAQCGGRGNVAEWEQATRAAMAEPLFRRHFGDWDGPWNFAGVEETEARLEESGFEVKACWLEEKPIEVADARSYLEVVGLAVHLDRLPENLRDQFVDAVLRRVDEPNTLRYIRLNIEAGRPETAAGHAA